MLIRFFGIPKDHIIVMMKNDIAYNSRLIKYISQ